MFYSTSGGDRFAFDRLHNFFNPNRFVTTANFIVSILILISRVLRSRADEKTIPVMFLILYSSVFCGVADRLVPTAQ